MQANVCAARHEQHQKHARNTRRMRRRYRRTLAAAAYTLPHEGFSVHTLRAWPITPLVRPKMPSSGHADIASRTTSQRTLGSHEVGTAGRTFATPTTVSRRMRHAIHNYIQPNTTLPFLEPGSRRGHSLLSSPDSWNQTTPRASQTAQKRPWLVSNSRGEPNSCRELGQWDRHTFRWLVGIRPAGLEDIPLATNRALVGSH